MQHILEYISFKGAKSANQMQVKEGFIVQDADRLDALGAIGIARCFSYGGYRKRVMYDPEEPPIMHTDFEEYKKSNSSTINHFYEKLFLLKDMMGTSSGSLIAQQKHAYMEQFVALFKQEWTGK